MVRKLRQALIALHRPFAGVPQAGMTLIEIIIVVALLGTLMAFLVRSYVQRQESTNIDLTKSGMALMHQSLQMYKADNLRFPSADQGLQALVNDPGNAKKWRGPYADAKQIRDAWGEDVAYEIDGNRFRLISAGPDGEMGTEDDIHYPESDDAN